MRFYQLRLRTLFVLTTFAAVLSWLVVAPPQIERYRAYQRRIASEDLDQWQLPSQRYLEFYSCGQEVYPLDHFENSPAWDCCAGLDDSLLHEAEDTPFEP